MEKVKYSGECELKTRTASIAGESHPTLLRVAELCYEYDCNFPQSLRSRSEVFLLDNENMLMNHLKERGEFLIEQGEDNFCFIVQTFPLNMPLLTLRERVIDMSETLTDVGIIEQGAIAKRFERGEVVVVLWDDYVTLGVIACPDATDSSYEVIILDKHGACKQELAPASRVVKRSDWLQSWDLALVYKLKKTLFSICEDPSSKLYVKQWCDWEFFESHSDYEDNTTATWAMPIPNMFAKAILGIDIEISEEYDIDAGKWVDDRWHYRLPEDRFCQRRMLWGYKKGQAIEQKLLEDYPVGFWDWLQFNKPCSKKFLTIDKSLSIVGSYSEWLCRQMSPNHIINLSEHLAVMEELFANGDYPPEQKEKIEGAIKRGRLTLTKLKVPECFQPYGVVDNEQ